MGDIEYPHVLLSDLQAVEKYRIMFSFSWIAARLACIASLYSELFLEYNFYVHRRYGLRGVRIRDTSSRYRPP